MIGQKKFKKGAASFYVVAFSTLILLIIVASFTALVISQIMRSSNADLAQSAYDSALAGVEDARIAFYNYQNCLLEGAVAEEPVGYVDTCSEIIYVMEKMDLEKPESCDMVSYILHRKEFNAEDDSPTIIQESNEGSENNMAQSYTCVKIKTKLGDYRGELSEKQQMKIVRPRFENIRASDIEKIKISWGNVDGSSGQSVNYSNFNNGNTISGPSDYAVTFNSADQNVAIPPTISVALLQTANTFKLDDFEQTQGNQTDRGMLYLVPTGDAASANNGVVKDSYYGAYTQDAQGKWINLVRKEALLKSNDRTSSNEYNGKVYKNVPYAVYCNESGEFLCSTTIELPEPVGASGDQGRSDDTFTLILGLPYGKPSTDFSLKFFCKDGAECGEETVIADDSCEENEGCEPKETTKRTTNQALLKGLQVGIDSTGRANDLYRRIEVRMESVNSGNALSIMGPLELMGDNSGDAVLKKNLKVICEWNLAETETCSN